MDSALFTNIKKLYENELYSSVIPTASLLMTLMSNDRNMSTPELEYQTTLYFANSYYFEGQYRLAVKYYEAALLLRKTMQRFKNGLLAIIEAAFKQFLEEETRYRLATSYRKLNEPHFAIATLQALNIKLRTPKVNMLLGKLLQYGRSANSTESVAAFRDVLKDCPMALEASESLLALGVDGIEVNSLVVNACSVPKNIEWLSTWIKGFALMYGRKHLEAAKVFIEINDNTKFHQNEHLLTMIGRCYYYYGSFNLAEQYLETAVLINPQNMEALMPLAVVYEYNQKLVDLDKLTSPLTNIHDFSSGHWFLLAQNFYANGKLEKASSFTHKAVLENPRNIEAHLLRGKICLQMKRFKDATYFFRAAQCITTYRFEIYKGLFHCYVGLKRIKEAQTMCALAVRYFRNSPRSYVMFSRTLFHSTHAAARKSAKKFVAKALEIDEHYAPAVALMAEIYQADGETQQAVTMLKKHVTNYPHHKLFTMLGDILSSEKELNQALEYYTIALSMEPTYHRALEGVNALGHHSNSLNKQETDRTARPSAAATDEEWPIECEEPSIEAVELSSPAVNQDEVEAADAFTDPFWQDVDNDIPN